MSAGGLVAWLGMAFAAEPAGAFIEVRWRLPDRPGMGQLWQPVERREAAIDSPGADEPHERAQARPATRLRALPVGGQPARRVRVWWSSSRVERHLGEVGERAKPDTLAV